MMKSVMICLCFNFLWLLLFVDEIYFPYEVIEEGWLPVGLTVFFVNGLGRDSWFLNDFYMGTANLSLFSLATFECQCPTIAFINLLFHNCSCMLSSLLSLPSHLDLATQTLVWYVTTFILNHMYKNEISDSFPNVEIWCQYHGFREL